MREPHRSCYFQDLRSRQEMYLVRQQRRWESPKAHRPGTDGGAPTAVSRTFPRAILKRSSAPTPQLSPKQPQLTGKYHSAPCRREGATGYKKPVRAHLTVLAETADRLENSLGAALGHILVKLGSGEGGGEQLLDDEGVFCHDPGEAQKSTTTNMMIPGVPLMFPERLPIQVWRT